jgi:hypothetical protein
MKADVILPYRNPGLRGFNGYPLSHLKFCKAQAKVWKKVPFLGLF